MHGGIDDCSVSDTRHMGLTRSPKPCHFDSRELQRAVTLFIGVRLWRACSCKARQTGGRVSDVSCQRGRYVYPWYSSYRRVGLWEAAVYWVERLLSVQWVVGLHSIVLQRACPGRNAGALKRAVLPGPGSTEGGLGGRMDWGEYNLKAAWCWVEHLLSVQFKIATQEDPLSGASGVRW